METIPFDMQIPIDLAAFIIAKHKKCGKTYGNPFYSIMDSWVMSAFSY